MVREIWVPKLNQWVEHREHKWVGQITEITDHWVEVLWNDTSHYGKYQDHLRYLAKIKSPQEMKADKRLREESLGITDDWREYDGEEVS